LVRHLAFAADGRTLASASADTTALLWAVRDPAGRRPADTAAAWDDLAGADAARAYDAVCALAARPEASLRWLAEHLHPAAEPPPGRVDHLLRDLDSNQFAERQRATRELEQLGELAEAALRKALAGNPSLEVRQRIERLLNKEARLEPAPDRLRAWRAVEVLEAIGTPAAREILAGLARGAPAAGLTQRAKAAVERLGR
jgi:hypothetical protein